MNSDELVHPPPCLTLPLVGSKQGGSPEPLCTCTQLAPWTGTSHGSLPALRPPSAPKLPTQLRLGAKRQMGRAKSDKREVQCGRKT